MGRKKIPWDEIKRVYVEGNMTLQELADTYKKYVSYGCITKRSAKENWLQERKLYRAKVEILRKEKRTEELASDAASFDATCFRAAEMAASLVEEKIRQLRTLPQDMIKEKEIRLLEKLGNILKLFQSIGKTALGEDPEDKKADAMYSWAEFMRMAED